MCTHAHVSIQTPSGPAANTRVYDIEMDTVLDKPWRKPGADVTDYFNYGFNEDSWRQYCKLQVRECMCGGGGERERKECVCVCSVCCRVWLLFPFFFLFTHLHYTTPDRQSHRVEYEGQN
jgi:hypothetical protein